MTAAAAHHGMHLFRFAGDLSHLLSFFFLLRALYIGRNAKGAAARVHALGSTLVSRLSLARGAHAIPLRRAQRAHPRSPTSTETVPPGISLKTQELYLLVFVARYLDLFTNFYSLYNTIMKVIYLGASGWIVHMIRHVEPWNKSYKADTVDDFLHVKFAIVPCLVLALLCNDVTRWWGVVPLPLTSAPTFTAWFFEYWWAFSIYLEAIAIMPQLIVTQRAGQVENITSLYMASLGAYRALYVCNWVWVRVAVSWGARAGSARAQRTHGCEGPARQFRSATN